MDGDSHRHKCKPEYPLYMGSKKHEFACISVVAVHIDTKSINNFLSYFVNKLTSAKT